MMVTSSMDNTPHRKRMSLWSVLMVDEGMGRSPADEAVTNGWRQMLLNGTNLHRPSSVSFILELDLDSLCFPDSNRISR